MSPKNETSASAEEKAAPPPRQKTWAELPAQLREDVELIASRLGQTRQFALRNGLDWCWEKARQMRAEPNTGQPVRPLAPMPEADRHALELDDAAEQRNRDCADAALIGWMSNRKFWEVIQLPRDYLRDEALRYRTPLSARLTAEPPPAPAPLEERLQVLSETLAAVPVAHEGPAEPYEESWSDAAVEDDIKRELDRSPASNDWEEWGMPRAGEDPG